MFEMDFDLRRTAGLAVALLAASVPRAAFAASTAGSFGGSVFSWVNQGAATVTETASGVTISQPPHENQTNQAGLTTPMAPGSACYSVMMQSPANSSLYNGGMLLQNGTTGAGVVFEDVYANDAQSNIDVVTEGDQFGDDTEALSTGSYADYVANSQFWERVCIDSAAGAATFLISPTGKADSFQSLLTAPLASLHHPDHVGVYVDADPQGFTGYPGSLTVHRWQVTPFDLQAAAPGGDPGGAFQTVPMPGDGFPASNSEPTVPGDTPKFGLPLAPGARNVVDLTFPGSGEATVTVGTSAAFRKRIYLNFGEGDLNSLVGDPQDSGQGPNAPFWGRARSYPVGDPNDLLRVTTDGLKMLAHCGGFQNDNCTNGQIRSAFFRLPTVFRPGMTMEVTYKPATGFHSWNPWWLFTGEQNTPYPGANAFVPGLWYGSTGPDFEIDMNDNYPRADLGGCPIGGQVDFGTPDIYGTHWNVAPYMVYAANSGGWASRNWGDATNSTSNNYECETGFVPGSKRTMLLNWRNDGSNQLDVFVDGKRVNSAYMEYPQTQAFSGPDGANRQLGMEMMFGGQNVPTFDPPAVIEDNDGIQAGPGKDAGWTETIYSVKAWIGKVDNPGGHDAGSNAANGGRARAATPR
jgi:hypothetical protein